MNLATLCWTAILIGAIALGDPPASRTAPVFDTFHGVTVTEQYRWLEDAHNPEVGEILAFRPIDH